MNRDKHYLENRFLELANLAYSRNIYTNTDFLNLNELSILNECKNELPPVKFELIGGSIYAERKIALFYPTDIGYESFQPLVLLKIAPINSKYADDLTHRDFLGAILNLGIERCKIGDIFIKDNCAYIYCLDQMTDYIKDNLRKVRHTLINTDICNIEDFNIKPNLQNITGTISNVRLDSVISTAFKTSRNSIISLIEGGKVFVNGKMITSNGYSVKEQDVISVRGKGRFIYNGIKNITKKGRNLISIDLYV